MDEQKHAWAAKRGCYLDCHRVASIVTNTNLGITKTQRLANFFVEILPDVAINLFNVVSHMCHACIRIAIHVPTDLEMIKHYQ